MVGNASLAILSDPPRSSLSKTFWMLYQLLGTVTKHQILFSNTLQFWPPEWQRSVCPSVTFIMFLTDQRFHRRGHGVGVENGHGGKDSFHVTLNPLPPSELTYIQLEQRKLSAPISIHLRLSWGFSILSQPQIPPRTSDK